jgi:hypothetical protein
MIMKRIAAAILPFAVIFLFGDSVSAGSHSWMREFSVKRGHTIKIQTMYNIYRNCFADRIPPTPKVQIEPRLGKLSFRSGKTVPYQCPNETVNANFADYRAGNKAGVDRFYIRWSIDSHDGSYDAVYVVRVE